MRLEHREFVDTHPSRRWLLAVVLVRPGWTAPSGPSGAEPTSSRSCFRDLAYQPLESEPVPRAAMGKGGGDLFEKMTFESILALGLAR